MKKILNEWKEYLFEQRQSYQMNISFKAEPDAKIYGSIFDEIRAIEGITIVKTTKRIGRDVLGNKVVNLNLKFLMKPGLGGDYARYVHDQLRHIKDTEGDRIIAVKITKLPNRVN
jgi:hypothetical protein